MSTTSMPASVAALEPPNRLRELAAAAVLEAVSDIGQGEVGGNNRGAYVWSLTGRRTSGAWCAAAVYAWHLRAAARLGYRLPVKRTHSARKLAARIAEVGEWLSPLEQPSVGDVALWSRGVAWQGHVGIVCQASGDGFLCVEGNRGKYPARVARYSHLLGEPKLLGFARLWGG